MTAHPHASPTAEERARLGRRAQLLAAASVSYNAIEAVIAIAAGLIAGSVALVGFGLDSIVDRRTRAGTLDHRHRSGSGVAGDHAVPLLGAAPHRTGARLERRRR